MSELAAIPALSKVRGARLGRWLPLALLVWVVAYAFLGRLSTWLSHDFLRLSPATHLGSAVAFFVYEAPKVLLLLTLVVFGVGVVRSFFTPEKTRAILAGKKESVGNVLAAALGVVTPFCSCSAVPQSVFPRLPCLGRRARA